MAKRKQARQKQREAHLLLQQSKLALQAAMLESNPTAKSTALKKATDLARTAAERSNAAKSMVQ